MRPEDVTTTEPPPLIDTAPSEPAKGAAAVTESFEAFFRSSEPARDKYLARLFGLFAEQVVRHWCACDAATYEDLGRPTLIEHGQARGHTLDFTLRHRGESDAYVAELKCELEYEGYRYLTLANGGQVRRHASSTAFAKFLRVAADPGALTTRCRGVPIEVSGAILIWRTTSPEGRDAAMNDYGFTDVLSVESMLWDLRVWGSPPWEAQVGAYRRWSIELFDFLSAD